MSLIQSVPLGTLTTTGFTLAIGLLATPPIASQTAPLPAVQLTVNSAADRVIADDGLTLREAILITRGELAIADLSPAEQAQVTPLNPNAASQIQFNLPADQTVITLESLLPELAVPGLAIDGTTQPGYDAEGSATAEILIPIPVVELTAAPGVDVLRGLTITADGVTVQGLSVYGFTSTLDRTAATPPPIFSLPMQHRRPRPATNIPRRDRLRF